MKLLAIAFAALLAAGAAQAQSRGVSDTEIVLGSHQDLSGPLALLGEPTRNGMQLAVDEINAAGGIHGRALRLVVEDNGYDPKQAVQATQKLLDDDKVFAMVGLMGTPTVMAAMPLVLKEQVPHLFPLTAAVQMYEPFDRLKFALLTPYIAQARNGTLEFIANRDKRNICVLHLEDEFGLNVRRGVEVAAEERGLREIGAATVRHGDDDYATSIELLRAHECDLVVLGTIIRETIAAMSEARKLGWQVDMLATSAAYVAELPLLGKEAVEGLFAAGQLPIPYRETATAAVQSWIDAYRAKFDSDVGAPAAAGYVTVMLAAEGLRQAGRALTVDSFIAGLERIEDWRDIFGSPPVSFGPERRLATEAVILAQVQQGRWALVQTGIAH